jgi:hypothetical protein
MPKDMIESSRYRRLSPLTEVYVADRMKRKADTKARKKKAVPRARNPMARTLKESGLFRPKVVPAADKDEIYRRRPKHAKQIRPADEEDDA